MCIKFSRALVRAAVGSFGMATCTGLVLAASVAAGPATNETTRMQAVGTADLNLSNTEGRAALDRRIRAAARTVCDIRLLGTPDQFLKTAEQRCYFNAVKAARIEAANRQPLNTALNSVPAR